MKASEEGNSHASGVGDEVDGEDQNMAEISKLRQQNVEDREKQLRDVLNHRQALLKELFFMMQHTEDVDGFMKHAPGKELEVNETEFRTFAERYPLPMSEEISKVVASLEESATVKTEAGEMTQETQEEIDGHVAENVVDRSPISCGVGQVQNATGLQEEAEVIPPKRPPERTTVAEQPPRKKTAYGVPLPPLRKNGSQNQVECDELTPLDVYAWQLRVQDKLLFKLVRSANKAILTNDWQASRREAKAVRALQRMDVLKMSNLWTFRQLHKHTSTPRTKTHWDLLMEEMRWLRTDFREERKWKIATAYKIGQSVLEWHAAEDKSKICVKRRATGRKGAVAVGGTEAGFDESAQTSVSNARQNNHPPEDGECVPSRDTRRIFSDSKGSKTFDPFWSLTPYTTRVCEDDTWAAFFASYPLYEPPTPDDKEAYLDEGESGRVTVVSRLMTKKFKVGLAAHPGLQKSLKGSADRGDLSCRDSDIPPWIDTAPEAGPVLVVVEPTPSKAPKGGQTAGLFATPPDVPPRTSRPSKPPSNSGHRSESNAAVWTDEEEDMLLHLAQLYQHNWDLIADIFNAQKALFTSPTSEQRMPYDCYEKWAKHAQAAVTVGSNQKEASSASLRTRTSSSSSGFPNRAAKFPPVKGRKTLGIMEAMKRVADRREMANMPPSPRQSAGNQATPATPRNGFGPARSTSTATTSRSIARSPSIGTGNTSKPPAAGGSPASDNRCASTPASGPVSETSASQAAANPSAAAESRVFSPSELSMIKAEKERQMSQALLAHQQQQAAVHYARQGNFRQAVPVISWGHQFAPGLPISPSPALQKLHQQQQQQQLLLHSLQVPVRPPFNGAGALPAVSSPQPDFMKIPHFQSAQSAAAGTPGSQGQQLTLSRADAALQHQHQHLHQQLVHQQFLQRRSAAMAQQQVIARLQQQLHHQQPQLSQQGIQQLHQAQSQQLHQLQQPQAQQLQQLQQHRAAMLRQQQEQRAAAVERLRQSGFLQRVQQMVSEGRITQEQAQQAINTRLHVGHAPTTPLGVPVGFQGSQSPRTQASELPDSTATSPPSEALQTSSTNDRNFYQSQ